MFCIAAQYQSIAGQRLKNKKITDIYRYGHSVNLNTHYRVGEYTKPLSVLVPAVVTRALSFLDYYFCNRSIIMLVSILSAYWK